jgi:ubiquinone/menaquinone biosynthesis C-methylase UbiE
MGIYEKYLLPRIIRLSMNSKVVHAERGKALAGARGKVLEVGFGNGLNLRHYPPEVERVVGIDPATQSARIARKDVARAPFPVEVRVGSAEALPFEDAVFDSVAVTWTLCTIPDPAAALREMRRVLHPGGRLHFIEHGLSSDAPVARWQERLNGLQKYVSGGCNLNRPIDRIVAEAGFRIESLENYYIKGPKTHTFMYRGVAAPARAEA